MIAILGISIIQENLAKVVIIAVKAVFQPQLNVQAALVIEL